jgi:hypothetical protein
MKIYRFLCVLLCFIIGSNSSVAQQIDLSQKRILLIGNSFTFMNQGLDFHLKKMSPSSTIESITAGGLRLDQHLANPVTVEKIKTGHWDVVVLQEQSQLPVFNYAMFSTATKNLQRIIVAAGAKPLLLMTWERPDSVDKGVTTENLLSSFQEVSREVGIDVAYAGYLFGKVKQKRPDISLYVNDGHPTLAGTYLASGVLFKSIFKQSPYSLSYTAGLDKETASYLRLVATETVVFR